MVVVRRRKVAEERAKPRAAAFKRRHGCSSAGEFGHRISDRLRSCCAGAGSQKEGARQQKKESAFLANNLLVCLCLGGFGGALEALRDQTDKR